MGVPKSKITRSKRGLRRAHDGIISGQYGECSNCGELKLSHHVCGCVRLLWLREQTEKSNK